MEIVRNHYRGFLEENYSTAITENEKNIIKNFIAQGRCLTVALYHYKQSLFLYFESTDLNGADLSPENLFPELSAKLKICPSLENDRKWAKMYNIYYHSIPKSTDDWARDGKKTRRGRIAKLVEDKLFSYVYYHKAIVDEGVFEGDKYQSIALHEDILFSYFEEPKIITRIKIDDDSESQVIHEWLKQDPESHFDHDLSGEENFLFIPEVFAMGKEDL